MRRFLSWKILVIIVLALVLGYTDLPDRFQRIPFTPKAIKDAKIHLGLDLQGGIQLDYKIDLRKVPENDHKQILEGVREVLNRRVNALGVSEPNILLSSVADEQHIIVELAGINDIEQAKRVVGKTIQLEFKEEKTEAEKNDPKYKENLKKQAQAVLQRVLKDPNQFSMIGQEEEFASPGKILYETTAFQAKEEIFEPKVAEKFLAASEKTVIPELIEGIGGFIPQVGGGIAPNTGFFIGKVLEKQEKEIEEIQAKEVSASHILIAYQGASRASSEVTKTKAEAKKFAEELIKKLKKGETTFESAAKEFSDEPGAETSAGKLPDPVKEGGSYVKPFTDAGLSLQKEKELSEITETEFGFHIIHADSIKPESKLTKKAPQVKYEYIFVSTVPDPWKETPLTGEQFKRADVQFDQLYQPYIAIQFDDEGAKLFEELTERNVGKQLAIFVGGDLISAPRVNTKISGGQAIITGDFTLQESQNLARDLNTGAIPAPVVLAGQFSIGATLGAEALSQSVKAGIIGILLIVIFMILYYRLPGLIASFALLFYSILFFYLLKANLPLSFSLVIAIIIFLAVIYRVLKSEESAWEKLVSFVIAIFALFFMTFLLSSPVVLTLAGVAGVILSIGMAVDANVLIFERTKEELRNGRPLSAAIEIGFDRAWTSIRDSNFSSLITTAILFYFGTSIIQGFALTLAAGILISMFTAITVTRAILMALVPTKFSQHLWLFGKHGGGERKTFDFIGKTKLWFIFSAIIILVGLSSMAVKGLDFGIDFKGGTLIDLQFAKDFTVEDVKKTLQQFDASRASRERLITTSAPETNEEETKLVAVAAPKLANAVVIPSEEKRFIIRAEHLDEKTHVELLEILKAASGGSVEEIRFTTIGPSVGETLKKRALLALGLALIMIVLYIAFAFRRMPKGVSSWKFGVCAIVALAHDAFIPVGIFSLLNVEIDAFFITALLTIIGFSVHDTIVVFDRIREHLKTAPHDMSLKDITNLSLRETMARSINTSLTTLLTLLALLFFGSASIFYFILALVIGIFVGTYSSIFIAAPLLVLWHRKKT